MEKRGVIEPGQTPPEQPEGEGAKAASAQTPESLAAHPTARLSEAAEKAIRQQLSREEAARDA